MVSGFNLKKRTPSKQLYSSSSAGSDGGMLGSDCAIPHADDDAKEEWGVGPGGGCITWPMW